MFDLNTAAHLVLSIGLMALLALILGSIERLKMPKYLVPISIALAFSMGGITAMLAPAEISPGYIIDGRSIIVGSAAAFGGPIVGIIVAAAVGSFRFFVIGGAGGPVGTLGIVFAAILGYGWRRFYFNDGRPELKHLIVGGVVVSLHFAAIFMVPFEYAIVGIQKFYPLMLIISIGGTAVLGIMVGRERRLIESEQALSLAANIDPLTGLFNRRNLDFTFAELRSTPGETQRSCLIMFDIDHFKRVNDEFGHNAGDETLILFAKMLKKQAGPNASVTRMGGEEFCVLMPGASPAEAHDLANRVLEELRAERITFGENAFRVTVSAGIAELRDADVDPNFALMRADRALYHAKRTGRDRVVMQDNLLAA